MRSGRYEPLFAEKFNEQTVDGNIVWQNVSGESKEGKMGSKPNAPTPELIFSSDGLRTILNEPRECEGCLTMHYFFIRTLEGHRCPSCANGVASFAQYLPKKTENDKNTGNLKGRGILPGFQSI